MMMSANRLTIMEEEEDDLQSIGGNKSTNTNKKTFINERDKYDNFSFKMQSDDTPLKVSHNQIVIDQFMP